MTENSNFLPTSEPQPDVCGSHIEVRASLSSIELNTSGGSIQFGFTPTGKKTPLHQITGVAQVKLGNLSMDLGAWHCTRGACAQIAATTVDHTVYEGSLNFDVDFGDVTSGPSFVTKSALGKILRSTLVKGVKKLTENSHLAELPWFAEVREFVAAQNAVIFDAGLQSRLENNQSFVIYAPDPTLGLCGAYRTVATINSYQVDSLSTIGIIEQWRDQARGIRAGDIVLVRPPSQ